MSQDPPDFGQTPEHAPAHPILAFSDADLAALLKRVVRDTAVLGAIVSLVLWPAMDWQTAALFAVGAAISIGSVYEWGRLFRQIAERMDAQKTGADPGRGSGLGTTLVVVFFLLRLVLFAVLIYGSLKCFHGSPIALLCGLGLALAGLAWQAMRVLRG